MTKALGDVILERARQRAVEGWSLAHDDIYDKGELARAGASYALHSAGFRGADQKLYRVKAPEYNWPFGLAWWKPKDPRRDLVRAAALLIAEIERLDRLQG